MLDFQRNRYAIIGERDQWLEKRDKQREKHQQIIEEIEAEKVMEIEKLRKEMLL